MKNISARIFLFVALLSFLGCGDKGKIVAEVDGETLTTEEIKNEIGISGEPSTKEIEAYSLQWVNDELLYKEALRQNIDDEEATEKLLEETKKRLLINLLLEKEINSFTEEMIADSLVKIYYKNHSKEFVASQNYLWISYVVFNNIGSAKEFRASAVRSNNWQKSKNEFSNTVLLAEDLVLFSEGSVGFPQIWKVGQALKSNEVSFPIPTQDRFFILKKINNFNKGNSLPQGAVEKEIRGRIVQDKRNNNYSTLLTSLKNKSKVNLFLTDKK